MSHDLQDAFVRYPTLWVQVESQSACEQCGVLWNYGDSRPEVVKVKASYVNIVNQNLTLQDFNDSAHRETDSALASTCSTNDTNLLTRLSREREILQNDLSFRPVAKINILELNQALRRPIVVGFEFVQMFLVLLSFLRNFQEAEAPLSIDHSRFDLHQAAN